MTNYYDSDEMKQYKAKQQMYRHAVNPELNLERIENDLTEMFDKCSDIAYYTENDDENLLADVIGDDEQAFEFRAAFGDLNSECEMLYDMLNYGADDVREHFNDFFCAVAHDNGLWGYDSYDRDYYDLESYMTDWAVQESTKRLCRLTKQQLIVVAQKCFRAASLYLGLKHRFGGLDAVYDIIKEKNMGLIETLKNIDEAYEKAEAANFGDYRYNKTFDKLIETLPDEMWVM